jgi:hypothetical protein
MQGRTEGSAIGGVWIPRFTDEIHLRIVQFYVLHVYR